MPVPVASCSPASPSHDSPGTVLGRHVPRPCVFTGAGQCLGTGSRNTGDTAAAEAVRRQRKKAAPAVSTPAPVPVKKHHVFFNVKKQIDDMAMRSEAKAKPLVAVVNQGGTLQRFVAANEADRTADRVFRQATSRTTTDRVASAVRFGNEVMDIMEKGVSVDGKKVKKATQVTKWYRSLRPMTDKEFATLSRRLRRRVVLARAVRKYPRLCDLDISWSQFEQHYSQISDYLDGSLVLRGHGSVDAPSSTVKAFWSR